MAEAVLTNQATVENCIGWTFSPQIGSPVGLLTTTPTGMDFATKFGCKSQSYTSWNCVSRLYVGGVYVSEQGQRPTIQTEPLGDLVGDIPTPEDKKSMTPAELELLESGNRIFLRGKGVVSVMQARKAEEAMQSSTLRAMAAGSKSVQTRSHANNPPDPNTGYYYSDILPVRSVAVSSMICQRETEPMPYSPQYQILAGRLNDPAQTGVLESLVKTLSLTPSTRYELAAMVRCGCMGLSVGEESFATDPIPYRFVRKPKTVSSIGMDILQKPGTDPTSWRIVAMPLDTFVALANNSYYSGVPGPFTYGGLDVTWIAVPVPSRLIDQSHLIVYLFSFLSSDAWSGTVSYRTVTTRVGKEGKQYKMTETYMPVVNGVDIPGVRNVCMVLIDETSMNSRDLLRVSLRDAVVTVHVWKGPHEVETPSFWPLWEKFWSKDNIPGIRRDTILAFNEICTRLGVSDACGTALSVLSELYGQWYQGIAPELREETPDPDYSKLPYGSWTYDGSPLDKTGQIKSRLFNLDQIDKVDARRRAIAYNFSGITPQHVFPTGVVRSRYVGSGEILRMSWSTQKPEVSVPSYNIQTMTSVGRVATAMGLILTHTESYRFASPTGFVHWVHMLASAISFSTSSFLSVNDISPKDWAGVYNKFDVTHREMMLNAIKNSMYGGILLHHDIENIYSSIDEWDLDIIADYWLMSPYNNINWMTFSPVPSHCTQQWMDKMGLVGGIVPREITTFMYKNIPYMAIKIHRDNGEHKMNMVSTIDVYRRYPSIIAREPGEEYECILHWIDNVAGYSNAACSHNRVLAPAHMYESLTYCASINNVGILNLDTTDWYVIGSNYEYNNPALSAYKVTPIRWPLHQY